MAEDDAEAKTTAAAGLLLDGRTALVTGGSRGLGREICLALARQGANVAFNYSRSEADAAATLQAIVALGRRGWAHKASVVDKAAVVAMVRAIEADAGGADGGVDILVNNAGFGQVVPLALMEEEDWDRMIDTHVKGAFLCSQAVLRGMVRRRRGR